MEGPCAVCNKISTKICKECKSAYYCSVEHQRQDWQNHSKTSCRCWKMKEDKQYGRYLVATRDIEDRELIFAESPLLIAPKILPQPTCLGCHCRLWPNSNTMTFYHCEKCGWPMCSKECAEKSVHQDECQIMCEKLGYKRDLEYINAERKEPEYCLIAPLRSLLLQKTDPDAYEKLMQLQSHYLDRLDSNLHKVYKSLIVPFIQNRLQMDVDEKTILEITGIWDTNSFEIQRPNVKIRGIYPMAAMLAHDCKPNSKHTFIGDDFKIHIYATRPIKKGEIISVTYTQVLWGTFVRRRHLRSVKYFDCTCERCSDKTECGLYVGSIYCPYCKQQDIELSDDNENPSYPKMLSCDPLDSESNWCCEKCEFEMTADEIQEMNDEIRCAIMHTNKSHPQFLEDFLDMYKDILHPTNGFVLDIKYALFQQYGSTIPACGFTLNELNDEQLDRKIEICQDLLKVANILEGQSSRFRGLILYDLQAALIVKLKREDEKLENLENKEKMQAYKKMLQEATEILINEPDLKDILNKSIDI